MSCLGKGRFEAHSMRVYKARNQELALLQSDDVLLLDEGPLLLQDGGDVAGLDRRDDPLDAVAPRSGQQAGEMGRSGKENVHAVGGDTDEARPEVLELARRDGVDEGAVPDLGAGL